MTHNPRPEVVEYLLDELELRMAHYEFLIRMTLEEAGLTDFSLTVADVMAEPSRQR